MGYIINEPIKAVKIARSLITDWNKEHFIGIYFSSKTKITRTELIGIGILNACLVHPRETFYPAVTNPTTDVIVLHNHASSDVEPSEDDITVTQRLKKAGEILGVKLHDHIIFSKQKWLSMKKRGII
jgi:DNA repair protein RadC